MTETFGTIGASEARDAGSRVPGRLRLENWDRLRVLAALDTVALHLAGEHAFFGFGLPLFLMLSVALGVSTPHPRGTGRFVRRRVDRILLPWGFWAGVLVLGRILYSLREGLPLFAWAEWPMVFYGPRIHLWFLPFIIVAGFAAHLAHRRASRSRLAPVLALVVGGIVFLGQARLPSVGWPFDQWLFSLPAIPLGYALGRAVALEPTLVRLRRIVGAGFLLVVGLGLLAVGLDARAAVYAFRFAGGLGLLVIATWLPNRPGALTARLTPLMLGVYILHPVVYLWLVKPAMCLVAVGDVRWLRVALTFPLTMLLVAALRRTPLARFL